MGNHPVGKGLFIWQIDQTEGGDPASIAKRAVELGLQWVAIKINDGVSEFGNRAKNIATITALRNAGVDVWAWGYDYVMYYPVTEGQLAADLTNLYDVTGYLIDVEAEAKQATTAQAQSFCNALNNGTTKPLGLCSYRWPSYHPELAWTTFLAISDFHAPQVYWVGASNPAQQLQRSYDELMALKPLPFVPCGVATAEGGWKPTNAELDEFSDKAKALDLPGIIYWVWQQAETLGYMPTIAAQDWSEPLPPEPPMDNWPDIRQNLVNARMQINRAIKKGDAAYSPPEPP